MSIINHIAAALFIAALLTTAYAKTARSETTTDQQLLARGCALAETTADYPLGIWECPTARTDEMAPLPPVVPEDDPPVQETAPEKAPQPTRLMLVAGIRQACRKVGLNSENCGDDNTSARTIASAAEGMMQ